MATSLLVDPRGNLVTIPDQPAAPAPSPIVALDEKKRIIARLCAPFAFDDVRWRVIERTRDKKLGLFAAYVKTSVIIDRLNSVLGEGCWSRTYQQQTIENITLIIKEKPVLKGKIALICELDIPGVGKNAGTGEMWSDDANAVTSADSQAFKRAAECFGIGLYLKRVEKVWASIDQYSQPTDAREFRRATAASLSVTPPGSRPGQAPSVGSQSGDKGQTNGSTSRSQSPAQGRNTRSAPQSANGPSMDDLLAKKAVYIQALGEPLYNDAVAKARRAIAPNTAAAEANQQIMRSLDDKCMLLTQSRQLAADVSPQTVDQVLPRRAEIIRTRAGRERHLRRDQQAIALALDGLAQNLLRQAVRIDVGGIEHRHAMIEADVNQPRRRPRIGRTPGFEEVIATAEGRGAEAENRNAKT